jgi:hypothetical protein
LVGQQAICQSEYAVEAKIFELFKTRVREDVSSFVAAIFSTIYLAARIHTIARFVLEPVMTTNARPMLAVLTDPNTYRDLDFGLSISGHEQPYSRETWLVAGS